MSNSKVNPTKKDTGKTVSGKNSSGKLKTVLILVALALLLIGFCVFVYRFIFSEKAPAAVEGELSGTGTTATETTGGAETSVETTGSVEGGENAAVDTGTVETTAAVGDGENSGAATATQELTNTEGPTARNTADDGSVNGSTDGTAGENTEDSADTDTEAEAEDNGVPAYVENLEISIIANGEEVPCRYTGSLTSGGKIVGEGHFEFDNEDGTTWTFDGTCIRNNLWTGEAVGQPFAFSRGDAVYSARYTGTIAETVPEGQGTLRAEGTDGLDFTYTGGWTGGAYNGYGELDYDNKEIIRYHGNFEMGVYRPTFMQLIEALCSTESNGLKLTEQVKDYLAEHEDAILSHNSEDAYFGSGFSYNGYIENQDNPEGRCFETSMTVAQTVEYDESTFGYPLTEILAYANGGMSIYYGYYFGSCEGIESGDRVTVTAYPIGYVKGARAINGLDSYRFVAYKVEKDS